MCTPVARTPSTWSYSVNPECVFLQHAPQLCIPIACARVGTLSVHSCSVHSECAFLLCAA